MNNSAARWTARFGLIWRPKPSPAPSRIETLSKKLLTNLQVQVLDLNPSTIYRISIRTKHPKAVLEQRPVERCLDFKTLPKSEFPLWGFPSFFPPFWILRAWFLFGVAFSSDYLCLPTFQGLIVCSPEAKVDIRLGWAKKTPVSNKTTGSVLATVGAGWFESRAGN